MNMIEDDNEQAAIARILELRKAGKGYRRISRALNEAGLKSRIGEWHDWQVKRVLRRAGA